MRTLGDSGPWRGCQTVGLFHIRVSYQGNFFFFLDGALA